MKYPRLQVSALVLIWTTSAFMLLSACATGRSRSPSAAEQNPGGDEQQSVLYVGVGISDSLGGAIAAARADAVRQAVIDIIGAEQERAQQEQLQTSIYFGNNTSAFLDESTLETLARENIGTIEMPEFRYELRVRIDQTALVQVLRTVGSNGDGPQSAARALVTETDPAASDGSGSARRAIDADERQFLERYLRNLSYMVFFNEESDVESFLAGSAVTQANSYLAASGSTVFDRSQVERLKREAELVYEAETGREISLIQWVAQRLNADVYIELDAMVSGRSGGDRHFGAASVSLTMFESSTGQLLGSVNRSSPETFSRTSQQDAIVNALQSSVYGAMPVVVEQSQAQIARIFERGIRYELILQSTADTRLLTQFRNELERDVSDIQTTSRTADETRYAVWLYDSLDHLEQLVYEAAEDTVGLQFLYHVLSRGKSITFNTGL